MKEVLLWLWQLPQHLLGLLLIKITGARKANVFYSPVEARVYRRGGHRWGVSLGGYVILHDDYGPTSENHELGHSVQSRAWGPLYLLAVGLPSAVFNNLWDRVFHKRWTAEKRLKWYYGRWPEKQADRLGGVKREF